MGGGTLIFGGFFKEGYLLTQRYQVAFGFPAGDNGGGMGKEDSKLALKRASL